jgi:nucleotide-binding universal stress UspA family protein
MATAELQTGVRFKNILVGTDFSDASLNALGYAAAFSHLHDAKLFVAHVLSPEGRMPIPIEPLPPSLDRSRIEAERNLKSLATEEPLQHMTYEEILEEGPIGDVVLDIIRRKEIDLLVLGTHGRTGLKKLLLGSTAEELFRLAPCPVLTIGRAVMGRNAGKAGIRRVLFVTDFGAASLKALRYALSLANENAGTLTVLHVVPPVPVSDAGPFWYPGIDLVERQETSRRDNLERLQKLVPRDPNLACGLDLMVEFDFVPEGILRVASERAVDLIVMGVKRSSTARTVAHLPWAIAHEVVCQAKCPVLTVRA